MKSKNNKKFVISDLDGTLLDNPKRLSQNYIDKLNELIDQGLQFTVATGRDMRKTKKAVGNLTLKYPVILTNGALLADLNTEKFLEITRIPTSISNNILEMADGLEINPMVFAAYDPMNNILHFNKGKWGKKGISPLIKENFSPHRDLEVVSIQFHTEKKKLDPLLEIIQTKYHDQVNIIYIEDVSYKQYGIEGDWWWLEINSFDAGKDKMMRTLAKRLQIELEDIVVFGDNYNDIDILKIAGKAIVVENAPEEVKAIANEIALANTQGGVLKYILDHQQDFI
jgi:5-amino-6-(5-phospho-D-ribitylamino)uracil phosphatase